VVTVSGTIMAHPARKHWAESLALQTGWPITWDRHNVVWETARRAWQAADPQATHHVVIQDDAILCRDFVQTCTVLSELDATQPYCLTVIDYRLHGARSDYEQAVGQGAPFWFSTAAVSAVGLMLPVADLPDIVNFGDGYRIPHDDLKVKEFYRRRQRRLAFPIPNIVQHRNVDESPSLVPGNDGRWSDRTSSTFIGVDVSGLSVDWSARRKVKGRMMVRFMKRDGSSSVDVLEGSKAEALFDRKANWIRQTPKLPVPLDLYDPLDDPPPRSGPGSSRAAWEAYAHLLGIETTGLNRDEIMRQVDGRLR
jgi:hypothetical protein